MPVAGANRAIRGHDVTVTAAAGYRAFRSPKRKGEPMSELEAATEDFFNAFDDDASSQSSEEQEVSESEDSEAQETSQESESESTDKADPEDGEAEASKSSEETESEPEKAEDHQANYQVAMKAERIKRQELELTVKDLQLEIERSKTTQEQQSNPEQPIDYYTDPEAAIRSEVDRGVNNLRQEMTQIQQDQINSKFNLSEQYARKAYGNENYDVASQRFVESVKDDPQAQKELYQMDDPAGYAYRKGKELLAIDQHGGDIDKMIKAERAAAIAEYIENGKKSSPQAPPESLTKTASEAIKAEAPKGFNESGNFSELWNGSG